MTLPCPLCKNIETFIFQNDPFLRCSECLLLFKHPRVRLGPDEEKYRYAQHDNRPENPGYKEFLTPAMNEVTKRLSRGSSGLDFGCGPSPVLATMLTDSGYPTAHFDPYFYPEKTFRTGSFDFITCTEAAEHFFSPHLEFQSIFTLLKPNGVLVLMTELYREGASMRDWYYTRDPSHVSFFSKATLDWLAQRQQVMIEYASDRISVFSKLKG